MKPKHLTLLMFLLVAIPVLTACGQTSQAADKADQAQPAVDVAKAAPAEPRTVTAQVGAGQDTTTINAFLPSTLQVRVGDTITWKIDSDEIHTVTFLGEQAPPAFELPVPDGGPADVMLNPQIAFPSRLPGAPVESFDGTNFVNSGIMSKAPAGPDAPPNDTFSLTFDKPGLYPFVCLVHPYMRGVVSVEPAEVANVPSQAEIDARIKAELEPLTAQVEAALELGQMPRSEAGPDGSQLWYVNAGSSVGDPAAQTFEFLTKELTVNAGDTVVWTSNEFHTITFIPAPPAPEFILPKPQESGPPQLILNPEILIPAKPDQVYDPTQFYNSAPLGPGSPAGNTWSLTFDQPGTYKYFCAVHRQQGMEGTIIVKAS